MKTTFAAVLMLLSLNSFAESMPNLDCVGTVGKDSVKLDYRDGGAAFNNSYIGDLNQKYVFMAVLGLANPVLDTQDMPVTFLIGSVNGKTLGDKIVVMKVDNSVKTLRVKLSKDSIMVLSCKRLPGL